ncbi:hypothetical protein [Rubrobacter calidifluminis]|uniref:hypothetical protein n=1 Tax=Rubrobacter calidifluminis TaxID=1392640 RepID=UPI002361DC5B|nr:hypothetical protein [Rubrobacter calidifluminis]
MSEPLHCYRHPRRETRVTCATCGRPICTECMVQTEVGIKCPEDARLPRRARAGVMKPGQLLKSLLAGLLVLLAGLVVVDFITGIHFASLFLSFIAGSLAGTFVNRAGGRNGGTPAMLIAGGAVLISYLPYLIPPMLVGNPPLFLILSAAIATISAAAAGNH